jgi:hypothetical protein
MLNAYAEVVLGVNDDIRLIEGSSDSARIPILTVRITTLFFFFIIINTDICVRTGELGSMVPYHFGRANCWVCENFFYFPKRHIHVKKRRRKNAIRSTEHRCLTTCSYTPRTTSVDNKRHCQSLVPICRRMGEYSHIVYPNDKNCQHRAVNWIWVFAAWQWHAWSPAAPEFMPGFCWWSMLAESFIPCDTGWTCYPQQLFFISRVSVCEAQQYLLVLYWIKYLASPLLLMFDKFVQQFVEMCRIYWLGITCYVLVLQMQNDMVSNWKTWSSVWIPLMLSHANTSLILHWLPKFIKSLNDSLRFSTTRKLMTFGFTSDRQTKMDFSRNHGDIFRLSKIHHKPMKGCLFSMKALIKLVGRYCFQIIRQGYRRLSSTCSFVFDKRLAWRLW